MIMTFSGKCGAEPVMRHTNFTVRSPASPAIVLTGLRAVLDLAKVP